MKKQIVIALSVGLIILLGAVFLGLKSRQSHPHYIIVEIAPGSSTRLIGHQLHQQGLIGHPDFFSVMAILLRADKDLHAGLFKINRANSYFRIIRILQEKEGPAELVSLTIPEGLNLNEIAELVEDKHLAKKADFLVYMHTAKANLGDTLPFLVKVPTDNLEGYLFPDTYIFARGVPVSTIVKTMLSEFDRQVMSYWDANPSLHGQMSLHHALTLASLIERESGRQSEMSLISAVFHNRLNAHIPLGSCPTVAYALGVPRKRYIYFKDLKVESSYNTYRYVGLPPTPIASPGILAFKAALNPSKNAEVFFFVANGDGTHQFSHTFKEHCEKQRIILKRQSKDPMKHGYLIVDPVNPK